MNDGIDIEFFQGREKRRQVAHIGGNDVRFTRTVGLVDVVAGRWKVEQCNLVAGIGGVARGVGADQSRSGNEYVHRAFPPGMSCTLTLGRRWSTVKQDGAGLPVLPTRDYMLHYRRAYAKRRTP